MAAVYDRIGSSADRRTFETAADHRPQRIGLGQVSLAVSLMCDILLAVFLLNFFISLGFSVAEICR